MSAIKNAMHGFIDSLVVDIPVGQERIAAWNRLFDLLLDGDSDLQAAFERYVSDITS